VSTRCRRFFQEFSMLLQVADVKGFLEPQEGRRLYALAREAAPLGPCLEIGGYCGKSAVCLGTACRDCGSVLFSIDHHCGSEEQQPGEEYFDPELWQPRTGRIDSFPAFRETIRRAGLQDTVVPIVCHSELAARRWATPLSLVFIDGGHAYPTVLSDFHCWSRHLLPGGFLLFHDVYPNPDDGGRAPFEVLQAALETDEYEELPMTGSLGVLKKRSH
jgi:predicted O-methyltransferase YrrM